MINQQLATLLRGRKTIALVILVLSVVIIGLIWQFAIKKEEAELSSERFINKEIRDVEKELE